MVDLEVRKKAAQAVRRFLDCQTTNDEYEAEYPLPGLFEKNRTTDMAIRAVYASSWYWFDDLSTHKLDGVYVLTPETKKLAERCVLFLQTGFEYEWKRSKFIGAFTDILAGICAQISKVITLGLVEPSRHPSALSFDEEFAAWLNQPEGDASVWPFYRLSDYESALQSAETTQ